MNYPKTEKRVVTDDFFGTKVQDPYRWLENNKSEEVQDWLKEQSAFTEEYLSALPHKEELKTQLKQLFSLDTVGFPLPKNGRYFFRERKGDQDMAVLYVKDGLEGESRVLIDPNTLSKDKNVVLKGIYPSGDAKFLAYELSKAGNDQNSIHILDVDTGETLESHVPDNLYPEEVHWLNDNTGFYYRRRPENVPKGEEKYHEKIYFHKLGTKDYLNDELVIDPMALNPNAQMVDAPFVELSKDGRYMIVTIYFVSETKHRTEIYFLDTHNPDAGFVPVVKGVPDALFFPDIYGDRIYIQTNHNASNWKLCAIDIDKASEGPGSWDTVIPESEAVLETSALISGRLFCLFLENVQSAFKEYDLAGNFVRDVELPGIGSIPQDRNIREALFFEEDGSEIFFEFVSFAIPPTVLRLDLTDNSLSVYKQMEAGFDTDKLETKQVWYESKDGTAIPMFVINKKGLELNGNNPAMLYGYGGFNVSRTPSFEKIIIPFIEKGGVYAIANLRGGGEFGEEWHKAGMRKNKQNVFDDFIAAAEWLIESKYTRQEKLAIRGGSNGGLLVNTVANQRPDLFKAVISHVPVTDMTRYQEFDGGRHWISDYGCVEEEDMVEYLLGYSPYHNVVDGEKYPATLIATSDSDDRVHPSHSYKMAARLQEANASDNPILLRVELKAGHSGASAISKLVETYSDIWAFVFQQLGVE